MALTKDIVILDITEAQPGICYVRCLFWIPINSGYPISGLTSGYPAANSDPDTSTLNADLQAGKIREEQFTLTLPIAIVNNFWTTVETLLLAALNARKNYRAGTLPALPDPGSKYQIKHDVTTGWSS